MFVFSFDYEASEDMITITTDGYVLKSSHLYNLTLIFEGFPSKLELEGLYAGSYWESRDPPTDVDFPGNETLDLLEHPQSKNELMWYAVTQMEPAAARKVFPCFDEPLFKSIFKITVLHESDYNALSNMPVERKTQVDHKPGWLIISGRISGTPFPNKLVKSPSPS